jgi:hypothetical protein
VSSAIRDLIYSGGVTRRFCAPWIRDKHTDLALAKWLCRTADQIDPV